MTLVDSLDSILMLYSYAGFPERSWVLFERRPAAVVTPETPQATAGVQSATNLDGMPQTVAVAQDSPSGPPDTSMLKDPRSEDEYGTIAVGEAQVVEVKLNPDAEKQLRVKKNMMSGLSIVLTLVSILLAFRYVNYKVRIIALICEVELKTDACIASR